MRKEVYWLGFVAAAAAFADAAFYLVSIGQEDTPNEWGRVASIAALILLAGVLAASGSLATGNTRVALLGAATAILLVIGFLALMSIGLPLLFAGIVTASGALTARRERRQSRPPAPPPRSASSPP